jgi:trans-aconitate methyltransferase
VNDWDASLYHRVSGPQFEWGLGVLDLLAPGRGETILDLGCGTGRLTAEIFRRMGDGRVVGLDRSAAMLATAAEQHRHVRGGTNRFAFVRGDGAALPFVEAFDAVFSAATLHWIADHDAAFRSVFTALKAGGRFVAQCGGGPNLRRLLDGAHRLMESERYREHFRGWSDPWLFADAGATRARLLAAGFDHVETSLVEAPTRLENAAAYQAFIATVCVRHHVDRLPGDERPRFVRDLAEMAAGDDPPYTLDYWRLNISARKPVAGALDPLLDDSKIPA